MSLSLNIASIGHKIIRWGSYLSYQRFNKSLEDPQKIQKEKLSEILKYLNLPQKNYEDFKAQYSPSCYDDQKKWILEQKKSGIGFCPELVRFQPTSGSTASLKWIPYSRQLLKDFNSALNPWMFDLYNQDPEIQLGRHFWSLSWLPTEYRNQGVILNDTEVFPKWKQWLLKTTMAIHERIDLCPTSESSLFATLVYLVHTQDLTLISVWSPSFLIHLIEQLLLEKEAISASLSLGKWQKYTSELQFLKCPTNRERSLDVKKIQSHEIENLWPKLKLISCWDTASSEQLALQVRNILPHIPIQGKGLWATEGVVTIPFKNKYVLAIQCHFYEFRDVETKAIVPSWELKLNQIVEPVITTSGGLIRYQMEDLLKVTGFLKATPCLHFLGRQKTSDLVGEKISFYFAKNLIDLTNQLFQAQAAFFVAFSHAKGNQYHLIKSFTSEESFDPLNSFLEIELCKNFHYSLARELGQLLPVKVHTVKNPWALYEAIMKERGLITGNIKPEPLLTCNLEEWRKYFESF